MAQKPPASVSPEQSEAIAATGSTMLEPTETTAERRDEVASKLVDRFAIWSGVAGLIPVPVIDAVAVTRGRMPADRGVVPLAEPQVALQMCECPLYVVFWATFGAEKCPILGSKDYSVSQLRKRRA
jgi:hypothetical protein